MYPSLGARGQPGSSWLLAQRPAFRAAPASSPTRLSPRSWLRPCATSILTLLQAPGGCLQLRPGASGQGCGKPCAPLTI